MLIHFSFISSGILSFFLFLQCQKETKVDLWRRKTGKEKITPSRENRQEKENRTWEFFLREITWDWNNWNFCLLLTHTHPLTPFSSWSWLTCTSWQARRCLFCCCSSGWSHQKGWSQEMFCVGIKWEAKLCSAALSLAPHNHVLQSCSHYILPVLYTGKDTT